MIVGKPSFLSFLNGTTPRAFMGLGDFFEGVGHGQNLQNAGCEGFCLCKVGCWVLSIPSQKNYHIILGASQTFIFWPKNLGNMWRTMRRINFLVLSSYQFWSMTWYDSQQKLGFA